MQTLLDFARLSLVGFLFFLTVPRRPEPALARVRRRR